MCIHECLHYMHVFCASVFVCGCAFYASVLMCVQIHSEIMCHQTLIHISVVRSPRVGSHVQRLWLGGWPGAPASTRNRSGKSGGRLVIFFFEFEIADTHA